MEGLKRDANALNKEIGSLRKVLRLTPSLPILSGINEGISDY